MLYYTELLLEAVKAAGRIAAGFALMYYRLFFKLLKICLVTQVGIAVWRLSAGIQNWMYILIALIILGVIFIAWTHSIVGLPGGMKNMIVTGPFAIVRHPMYSGWCLVSIGAGWLGQHWSMELLAVLQTLFMFSVSCAEDEENVQIFGEAYIYYRDTVWMMGILLGFFRYLIRKLIIVSSEKTDK